ncbi:MAG: polysaccharide deacetylase family protein [Alphaproteobacteria bacterium]|jgi:hypothetical protein
MPYSRQTREPTEWDAFHAELDAWDNLDQVATFWWRDDDATQITPALEQLLDCAGETPLSLAVIPRDATPELARALDARPHATVLQHGYAHINHAPENEKKSEFGDHRPTDSMRRELQAGFKRVSDLFGARFLPIFVPPWNRVTDDLLPLLPGIGFRSYSSYGPATQIAAAPKNASQKGLTQINTHADIVNWRHGRGFLGEAAVLDLLTTHLTQRRRGVVDDQPTGLLTHHADHDDACWEFIEKLLGVIQNHPATAWWTPTL